MNRFTILLIEDQIPVTAQLVWTAAEYLHSYTLAIAKNSAEVITEQIQHESVQPQLIIIGATQLTDASTEQTLSALTNKYPQSSIFLLNTITLPDDQLIKILSSGVSNYYDLSPAGLLTLGRQLKTLQNSYQEQESSAEFLLYQTISADTSDLAVQLISTDYQVKAWNQATELFFNTSQDQAIGHSLDDLPISTDNISRLKDILDQAFATNKPFFLPSYHFEGTEPDTLQQVQIHAYPVYSKNNHFTNICVVITPLETLAKVETTLSHKLQTLLETNRIISEQPELQPTLQKVIEQTKLLLNGDNCQIYLLEKDNKTLRPVLAAGSLAEQIQNTPLILGQGVLGHIVVTGKITVLNHDAVRTELPYPTNEHVIGAPLTSVGGTIGLIIVSRQSPHFSTNELRFFETLVQQSSSAINRARLFEETSRSLNELATLYEASTAISTQWDSQDVLNLLITKVVEAINVSYGLIASWSKNQNKSTIEAEYISQDINPDHKPFVTTKDQHLNLGKNKIVQTVLTKQRPMFLDLNTPSLDSTERKLMAQYNNPARLLIPLVSKGETIGWLDLWETHQLRTFTSNEVRIARTLGSQIAVALQNAQYRKQSERTIEESTALYRVASALTTLQEPQAIISTVLQEYVQALYLSQGSVVIFNYAEKCGMVRAHIRDSSSPNGLVASYRVSEGLQIFLQNNPVYERLMRTRQPVVIDDPQAEWITKSRNTKPILPLAGWGDEDTYTMLIIPIRIREEIIGTLAVENTHTTQPFDHWAISLGQAMADQLGVGLQNVQLYEAEYQRREESETLREVSSVVGSSLNLSEVLERILDELGRVIKYDSAAIHLIEGKQRRVIAGRGFDNPANHIGLTFPVSPDPNEPGSLAIQNHQPLVYANISDVNESFREDRHKHIKSWMGIPLIVRDKVIGLISIDHGDFNAYTEDDVRLAQTFANQVAIALENARLYNLEKRELKRELDFAQEIQETLLPQFVPQVPGLDIAGRNIPARQVGGDFFHFFSTNPEQLGVAIGDVSGKGIPAALYMAAGITAIDTQTGPDVMPGELLNKLNSKLYNRLQENKMNIALQVATFIPLPHPENANQEARKKARGSIMTVASAGMIAPIGATKYGCRFLPVGGFPIGALPADQHQYFDEVFLLDPFTTIIFTSDGIVEAQSETGEMFGFDRLEKTILEAVDKHTASEIAEYIIDATQHFMGTAEQHDDMTVVVVVKT